MVCINGELKGRKSITYNEGQGLNSNELGENEEIKTGLILDGKHKKRGLTKKQINELGAVVFCIWDNSTPKQDPLELLTKEEKTQLGDIMTKLLHAGVIPSVGHRCLSRKYMQRLSRQLNFEKTRAKP